jgi:CelD/BcsL family acetyltransferase involved in cellulose biosynthesis
LKLVRIDPQTDPLWQEIINRYNSDVFHTPEWMSTLTATYDFNFHGLAILDDSGQPRSGMAYCLIEDMMDPRIVSLPFSDFCDPLVEDSEEWNLMVDALLHNGHRLSMRCLRNEIPLHDERFKLANRAKWHCVDVRKELDTLWMDLHGSARRAIKKAKREQVDVRIASQKDELRSFYELHLKVRKYKYQLLAQPYRFFEQIWDQFITKGNGALMLAHHQDIIIGGVLYLEWQNKLYYKFNASNPEYRSLRPNDLVVWEGMKYAHLKGYDYLDFGLSDWDQEGLLQYKRKFASEEKTVSFLSHTPSGSPSRKEKQIRNLLPQLTDLFVDEVVPDQVTEKAGDVLYRLFT